MLAARLESDAGFRETAGRYLVEQGTLTEEQAKALFAQRGTAGEPSPTGTSPMAREVEAYPSSRSVGATRTEELPSVGGTRATARAGRAAPLPGAGEQRFDDSVLNPKTVAQSNPYPNLPSSKALYAQF